MLRSLWIILVCILSTSLMGQKSISDVSGWKVPENKKINFGFKLGINSSSLYVYDLDIQGYTQSDAYSEYQIGYSGVAFMRFNFPKGHFFQPELSYYYRDLSTYYVMTPLALYDGALPDGSQTIQLSTYYHSIDLALLYGYNVIKKGPYSLNLFGGPVIKYIFNHQSENTLNGLNSPYIQTIEEHIQPLMYNLLIGVGVSISYFVFDFKYEIGISPMYKEDFKFPAYNQNPESPETNKVSGSFHRSMGTLSFSVGVIL